MIEAAEHLPVGVLDPAFDHLLVGQLEGVLEIAEPDHQPDRHAGPAELRVAQVDLLSEARAPEVVGRLGVELGGLHRNRRISTIRQSTILGHARKSLTSNSLLIFRAD